MISKYSIYYCYILSILLYIIITLYDYILILLILLLAILLYYFYIIITVLFSPPEVKRDWKMTCKKNVFLWFELKRTFHNPTEASNPS